MKIKSLSNNVVVRPAWRVDMVVLGDGSAGAFKSALTMLPEFHKERFARKIDEFFGFGLVPEVRYARFQGREGIVKKWVYGGKLERFDWKLLPQLQMLALFDMVANNHDRWENNYQVDGNGKVWAIDNENILMPYPALSPTIRFLFQPWAEEVREIGARIVARTRQYLEFVRAEYARVRFEKYLDRKSLVDSIESNIGILKHSRMVD